MSFELNPKITSLPSPGLYSNTCFLLLALAIESSPAPPLIVTFLPLETLERFSEGRISYMLSLPAPPSIETFEPPRFCIKSLPVPPLIVTFEPLL